MTGTNVPDVRDVARASFEDVGVIDTTFVSVSCTGCTRDVTGASTPDVGVIDTTFESVPNTGCTIAVVEAMGATVVTLPATFATDATVEAAIGTSRCTAVAVDLTTFDTGGVGAADTKLAADDEIGAVAFATTAVAAFATGGVGAAVAVVASGATEGAVETGAVGAAAGAVEAGAVGAAVGAVETGAVGAAVGPLEIGAVGAAVGALETGAVGAAVGALETGAVGAAVGVVSDVVLGTLEVGSLVVATAGCVAVEADGATGVPSAPARASLTKPAEPARTPAMTTEPARRVRTRVDTGFCFSGLKPA